MRLTELSLILLPIALFVLWRLAAAAASPRLLAMAALALLCLAAALIWLGFGRALGPGRYVPAGLQSGQVVPGHAERRR
jgi:hypothetical protein